MENEILVSQIDEKIQKSCATIIGACAAFEHGLIDDDKLAACVGGVTPSIEIAGLYAKTLLLRTYTELTGKEVEKLQIENRALEGLAIKQESSFSPPHPERIVYEGERQAWDALFTLNRASKDVFSNFKPIGMIADNKKSFENGTEYNHSTIFYRWGTPDNSSAPAVGHEFMHGLIDQELVPAGAKLYGGQCDQKCEDFGQDFKALWKNRYDQTFDYRLQRLLENYRRR